MSLVVVLTLKALAAGTLVAAFAALGERVRPQGLAGVLSAAPSVALASLGVRLVSGHDIAGAATGMVIGAVALAVACLVAVDTVRRFGALHGSMLSLGAWLATAAALYGVMLR